MPRQKVTGRVPARVARYRGPIDARPSPQVHTHLCHSEFDVVIDAIAALDADVTSIEAAHAVRETVSAPTQP